MLTQMPKGTRDVLPNESYRWHAIEHVIRDVCHRTGYREVRTPAFEHTELFLRGVGDTTDIVQKEMYAFEDKAGRSITLKPEGTAGVVRSVIEHGLLAGALPLKLYYLYSPVFRYENPQAGRLREHHQFGIEVFGAAGAEADVEIIALGHSVLSELGIRNVSLRINSIGCPACRKVYQETLRSFLKPLLPRLCKTCVDRYDRNPLRILDCKETSCGALLHDAPSVLDCLCDDCAQHFASLKELLAAIGIEYTIDSRIVRGLDYYTRTVFEYVADFSTGPMTVLGGGRYDGLVEQLGGPPTPGAGFGMGMERLIMALAAENLLPPEPPLTDITICAQGAAARREAFTLAHTLRQQKFCVSCDLAGKSLKAQFKSADRDGARIVLMLGDDELASNEITLRNMAQSTETRMPRAQLSDALATLLSECREEQTL